MAVASDQVTVEDTATPVFTAGVAGVRLTVANRGDGSVFLGGAGVTTSNGFQLDADKSVVLSLTPGDVVLGIVGSGTQTVHVISS